MSHVGHVAEGHHVGQDCSRTFLSLLKVLLDSTELEDGTGWHSLADVYSQLATQQKGLWDEAVYYKEILLVAGSFLPVLPGPS